jgi:hypothetical protein
MKTIGGTGKTVMNIYGRNESQWVKGNSLSGPINRSLCNGGGRIYAIRGRTPGNRAFDDSAELS